MFYLSDGFFPVLSDFLHPILLEYFEKKGKKINKTAKYSEWVRSIEKLKVFRSSSTSIRIYRIVYDLRWISRRIGYRLYSFLYPLSLTANLVLFPRFVLRFILVILFARTSNSIQENSYKYLMKYFTFERQTFLNNFQSVQIITTNKSDDILFNNSIKNCKSKSSKLIFDCTFSNVLLALI